MSSLFQVHETIMMLKFLLMMGLALVCQSYSDYNCEDCFVPGTYKCGPNSTVQCICNVGYEGDACQIVNGCENMNCNGGKCEHSDGRYECVCPEGTWGRLCEHTNSEVDHIDKEEKMLKNKHCGEKEECQPSHLKVVCGGGNIDKCDRSGNVRPYNKCPYPWYCYEAFRNGKCDWECERKECLYDGYECSTNRVCNKSCINIFGVCDVECDLKKRTESQITTDKLIIIEITLNIPENFWWENKVEILANLSGPLRTPLVYSAMYNEPLEKNINSSLGNVPSRARRSISTDSGTTVLNAQLMSGACNRESQCTLDCNTAASMISLAHSKQATVKGLYSMRCSRNNKGYGNTIVTVCVLVIGVFIVLIGHRVVSAPVWVPPPSVEKEPIVWKVDPPNPFKINPSYLHEEAYSQSGISLPIRREYVNRMDEQGRTPLFWLISSKKDSILMLEDVNELMNAGANPNHSDNNGETPLSIAIKEIRPSICARLIQWGADPTATSCSGASCLHVAVSLGDIKCVEWLLSFPAVKNNINEVDEMDRTPLAMAAQGGINSAHIVEILIGAGADVLHQGDHTTMWRYRGRSALHWAAQFNNLEVMNVLLHHRSDVNCVDTEGYTALFFAVQRGSESAVRILLEANASTDIPNNLGTLPITIAQETEIEPLIDLIKWYSEVRKEGLAMKQRGKKREKLSSGSSGYSSKRSCSSSDSPYFTDSNSNHSSSSSGFFFSSDSTSVGSGTSMISSSSSASSISGSSCPWSPSSTTSTSSIVLPRKFRPPCLPPIQEKTLNQLSFDPVIAEEYVPHRVLHTLSDTVVKDENVKGDCDGLQNDYSDSVFNSRLLSPYSENSNHGSGGPNSPSEHLGTSYWNDPEKPYDGFNNDEEILQEFFVNWQS